MRREATGEMVTRWTRDGYVLRLFDAGTDDEGREVLSYAFSDLFWTWQGDFGRRLFVGSDYRPSPLHALDSEESIAGLLGFLSLREGDTDSEYFNGYDERQLAWRDSDRSEELQLLVSTMEGDSDA